MYAGCNQTVVLTDLTPTAVDLLLDWMYDDFTGHLSFIQAVDMFWAAHKYNVTELQQHCERILKVYISCETCIQLAHLAMACHSSTLTQVIYSPHANVLCLWS